MKKIAITQRVIKNQNYYEIREALDIKWAKLFEELDFLPVVLPYKFDFKRYDFDGIILSGGNNIGEVEFRDNFELDLIKYALEKKIPVFGVCRGMQIIAKFFGCRFEKVSNQVGIKHKLFINQNSKYKKYLNALNKVNSFHNFAVNNVSNELLISAWNEDKTIIKAMEHKSKKILGVMWHSEREEPFIKEELKLIKDFFK